MSATISGGALGRGGSFVECGSVSPVATFCAFATRAEIEAATEDSPVALPCGNASTSLVAVKLVEMETCSEDGKNDEYWNINSSPLSCATYRSDRVVVHID